ncbi:MAG: UvrD-helicase domain-containing protein [Nitrospirales bacterium]
MSAIPDAKVRRLAETTFGENVVVVAGAGTGKTTLLVNRLLSVLLREPDPIPLTQVVALTFTNKAAAEMKIRLQEQLLLLVECDHEFPSREVINCSRMSEFQERYQLSVGQIAARAQAALDDLEQAQIGTLHSFAAHLLRLHPLECRVPPNFQEDDGTRLEEYFNLEWELWVHHELNAFGEHHDQWRRLLLNLRLDHIRQLAFLLCLEAPSLTQLIEEVESTTLSQEVQAWIETKHDHVVSLLEIYAQTKKRKIEEALFVAEKVFSHILNHGLADMYTVFEDDRRVLFSNFGKMPNGWTEKHFADARAYIRLAQAMFAVDHHLFRDLLRLLTPLVKKVQDTFTRDGWVTFQGLLLGARSLLRDYPIVRERLKQEYRAILVDEFQDTDPIQYEIILYLCEISGACALDWQDVVLTSGKLFIVGDPKQSIYTFRGADLEAFDYVVQKILDTGGVIYELETNFRSHGRVLDVINEVFNQLFQAEQHVQPGNVPLRTPPHRAGGLQSPGVEVRLVKIDEAEHESDSGTMTRLEAEQLARWIKEELLVNETVTDSHGMTGHLQPGHIGLLFRKLTHAQMYLEALQRHGIPYLTDGEKHFYRRQEVIDIVNVLRVIENPRDPVPMLGVLRSSLGGLTDIEVYELRQCDAFDCCDLEGLDGWKNPKVKAVKRLYEILSDIHTEAFSSPLGEILDRIFSRLPILELAMASLHGEQAVANLMKVRLIAVEIADRPHMSFSRFVSLLVRRLEEQPNEAERSLAEESLDAVRVLTIHKAKGLEFPVVILPGFHHGAQTGSEEVSFSSDWATGTAGISIGGRSTVSAVLAKEKKRIKEEAERRRLLYVAMTRAQERLVISGGLPARVASGAFLNFLQLVGDQDVGNADSPTMTIGALTCPKTLVSPMRQKGDAFEQVIHEFSSPPDLAPWFENWDSRDRTWRRHNEVSAYLTPTSQQHHDYFVGHRSSGSQSLMTSGALKGILIHRVLEGLNFAHTRDRLEKQIDKICALGITQEHINEREAISLDVKKTLEIFLSSSIYKMLQRAVIVGREIPFTLPWDCMQDHGTAINDFPCMMEGVIDLVYKLDGQVWLADYKTDRVTEDNLLSLVTHYQGQTEIYKLAAQRCLGLDEVKCQLFFVRLGKMVQV